MLSRIAGQSLVRASRTALPSASRSFASVVAGKKALPHVSDNIIEVTFIDWKADKFTVKAPVGHNLYQVARIHEFEFLVDDSQGGGSPLRRKNSETWTEDTFGGGIMSNIAHVVVSDAWVDTFPPPYPEEANYISELGDKIRDPRSRIATELFLEKKHDGLTVFVPDHLPIDWV